MGHFAAGRCEVTSVDFRESQFASELQPVVLTRSVPIAAILFFAKNRKADV
jgi:hypothetical protein